MRQTTLFDSTHEKRAKRGHAAWPGGGPDGKTCGDCEHCVGTGERRTFYKCLLMRHAWTNGAATDIRLKDEACSKFQET